MHMLTPSRVLQIVSIKTIGNVFIVTFLFNFIFAVIGVQSFQGCFSSCTGREACAEATVRAGRAGCAGRAAPSFFLTPWFSSSMHQVTVVWTAWTAQALSTRPCPTALLWPSRWWYGSLASTCLPCHMAKAEVSRVAYPFPLLYPLVGDAVFQL